MKLDDLVEAGRLVEMTSREREAQRRSFAYGNTKIENDLITRDTIDKAAQELSGESGEQGK